MMRAELLLMLVISRIRHSNLVRTLRECMSLKGKGSWVGLPHLPSEPKQWRCPLRTALTILVKNIYLTRRWRPKSSETSQKCRYNTMVRDRWWKNMSCLITGEPRPIKWATNIFILGQTWLPVWIHIINKLLIQDPSRGSRFQRDAKLALVVDSDQQSNKPSYNKSNIYHRTIKIKKILPSTTRKVNIQKST